jgi:geranylgeranyl diphosphate synthase type II
MQIVIVFIIVIIILIITLLAISIAGFIFCKSIIKKLNYIYHDENDYVYRYYDHYHNNNSNINNNDDSNNSNNNKIKQIVEKNKIILKHQSIQSLLKIIDNDIDKLLVARCNKNILESCKYSLSGGKKIRSLICYSIINHLNKNVDSEILPSVNFIEIIHGGSLIIDDIMDNDEYRRNKLSHYKKYGITNCLLASCQLFTISSYLLQNINKYLGEKYKEYEKDKIFYFVMDKMNNLLNGQIDDMHHNKMENINVYDIIKNKTASLFEMIFVIGWLVGGGDYAKFNEVQEIGERFGLMFQIYDDFEDYYQDLNKNINCLNNGINNAYDIFANHKKFIKDKLKKNNMYTTELKIIIEYLTTTVDEIKNIL